MTKSHKATQFKVDMCDNRYAIFQVKYINNLLQNIKRAFIKKQPKYPISTVQATIETSFYGIWSP
jgi:hypothetical protein